MNLDSAGGGEDPGWHNVVFQTGTNSSPPTLQQFDAFEYTFKEPGNYTDYCGFHPTLMRGDVRVVSSP